MELILAVNNDSVLLVNEIRSYTEGKIPLLTVVYYNEDIYKEKSNAFKLKGGYGARMTPFALLYDDYNKRPIKAFYAEDGSCNYDNIIASLTNFVVY